MPRLHRTVRALGTVSLLTDVSSEMIYPLLPSFVTGSLHAGPALLGLIEGLAEAAASLVKIASGAISDRQRRRKPLVLAGYVLSAVARPLVALATQASHLLAIRLADRFGKGTRGAPRDALVAQVTAPQDRGRAYGFHRAMDNTGALLGPLAASTLLFGGLEPRAVFALSALPGLASVLVLWLSVREEPATPALALSSAPRADAAHARSLRVYLTLVALFTLGNSSDAFLLLRAQEAGIPLAALPLLWTLHNAVKAATSTHGGALSDRFGRRAAIVAGWSFYAATYAGFALAREPLAFWLLFAVYGLYHALTEGPERALVADLAGEAARGRAFGLFHAVTGAMLLPASLLTGALWQMKGAAVALGAGAALAGLAALGLLLLVPETAVRSAPAPPR